MKRAKAYQKLQSALLKEKLVRVVRRFEGADRVDGFVVAVGDDWALLRQTDHMLNLNGWSALRIRDISAVDKLGQETSRGVQHRVLKARGEWPPTAPPTCLIEDLASVVATAQSVSPIVAIHREAGRPDALWVGAVTAVDSETLIFAELDAEAIWENLPTDFDSDDVTRIEFGTQYLSNLALVMGDIPG